MSATECSDHALLFKNGYKTIGMPSTENRYQE